MVERGRLEYFLSKCVLLGVIGLMSGCVKENVQGQIRTFSFETWMPLSATVVSLTVLGAACCWRRLRKLWGGTLLVIPALIIMTLVPELWLSRITIDGHGFKTTTGWWFWPMQHHIVFDDFKRMVIRKRVGIRIDSKDQRRISYYLVFERQEGRSETVPVGKLMQFVLPDLQSAAARQGLPCRDTR